VQWQPAEEREVEGMKATRSGSAVRAVTRRDFTKPVRVAASAKPRAKSEVFGTIVQHVGIHRRDVAGVFHVMGSMIKADLSKSGSGSSRSIRGS